MGAACRALGSLPRKLGELLVRHLDRGLPERDLRLALVSSTSSGEAPQPSTVALGRFELPLCVAARLREHETLLLDQTETRAILVAPGRPARERAARAGGGPTPPRRS